MSQRGQKSVHLVELATPVTRAPLQFVPSGTSLILTVGLVDAGSSDDTIIAIEGS
jgi:hypothetical protein